MTEKIREVFQEHRNHLMDCKKEDDNLLDWIGALDFIDNLAQLGVDFRMSGKLCEEKGEYLCRYCSYRGILGHCQYYKGSYSLKRLKGDVE